MKRSRVATVLLVVAIVAVALNQRPAIVAVGSVLRKLQDDTGLGDTLAGVLTAVPVLCFGAFAPVAPWVARRIGLETAVAVSLVLLAAGIALRLLTPVGLLYAGSLLAGAAIALANVLLPAFVKREFVRPGPVMGVYSSSLNVGAALGAAVTLPLGTALGVDWRGALGLWLVLAAVALALWLPVAGTGHAHRTSEPMPEGQGSWSLLRQPLARQVTAYLGLQSVQFYSVAAWLPTLLADAGVPAGEGGLLLGLANVVGAAGALLAPAQAGRMRTQRPLILVVALAYVIGLGGLLLSPTDGTLVWVAAFGLAQGSGFALALTLIVLRSPTPLVAARLGGVAQCLGYLLAAFGPLVLGALHDLTDGWSWPLVLLLAALVPMTWFGWGAGRNAVLAEVSAPSPEDARTPAASADPAAPGGR
jgi:CP family cyanate transporter-like MFS transporter